MFCNVEQIPTTTGLLRYAKFFKVKLWKTVEGGNALASDLNESQMKTDRGVELFICVN